MADLVRTLKDEQALAATSAWGGDVASARTGIRAMLLDCSNLSTQLETYAVDLLKQRTQAVTSLQVLDAAIRLREYSAKTLAMRHSLLSDVEVLSRNGDPGNLGDFKLVGGLGKGSFGAVLLVKVSCMGAAIRVSGYDMHYKGVTSCTTILLSYYTSMYYYLRGIRHDTHKHIHSTCPPTAQGRRPHVCGEDGAQRRTDLRQTRAAYTDRTACDGAGE